MTAAVTSALSALHVPAPAIQLFTARASLLHKRNTKVASPAIFSRPLSHVTGAVNTTRHVIQPPGDDVEHRKGIAFTTKQKRFSV
jgi:hypothetical protein